MSFYDPSETASRLAEALKAKNITPADFSRSMQVSRSAVNGWLNGSSISFAYLKKISRELDVSLDWLFFGVGSKDTRTMEEINAAEDELLHSIRFLGESWAQSLFQMLNTLQNECHFIHDYSRSLPYSDLIQQSNLAIAITDITGTLIYTNAAHLQLLGLHQNETHKIMAEKIFAWIPFGYHGKIKKIMGEIFNTGSENCLDLQIIRFDTQQAINVSANISIVQTHNGPGYQAILRPYQD
jgi:transcriptional regulator with XRE-family HTH domain